MAANSINAAPTKNFFVEMLTRDIDLKDAILDLLDNCIDGIQRTLRDDGRDEDKQELNEETPYDGFWASINVSEEGFVIEDNCGGIPLDVAQRYAFRMGKPRDITDDDNIATIGTYGIGMKRAIFKMGQSAEVISQTNEDAFKVLIQPDWLASDETWDLPLEVTKPSLEENGTLIEILELREEVANQLAKKSFQTELSQEIETLYSYILAKGLEIFVNDKPIKAKPLVLQWEGITKLKKKDREAIAPYLYEGYEEDVEVTVAVGFHRAQPSDDEIHNAETGKRRKRDTAGWTIVCNDRVVVANDKTIMTGWGEAGVPKYHPQHISISGIVRFKSNDARKLPITTTKRGIDASSELYLHVKDRMREGLKLFTNYTSKWKQLPKEERARSQIAKAHDPAAMFEKVRAVDSGGAAVKTTAKSKKSSSSPSMWKAVKDKKLDVEQRFIPNLPTPSAVAERKRISFNKPTEEVRMIGEFLFDDPNTPATTIGEACFEEILNQAQDEQ
ncbi:MAG: ATP-binding protein [Cyanobacteria bacterium J06553_1]